MKEIKRKVTVEKLGSMFSYLKLNKWKHEVWTVSVKVKGVSYTL